MNAILFAALLSALLGIPAYFYAKKPDKRGLVLIAAFVLLAMDTWLVQSPRVIAAVTHGGRLAELAIIHASGMQFGSLDVALAVMLIATVAALTRFWLPVALCVIVETYSFRAGLFIATMFDRPLPGAFFIILGIAPFLLMLKPLWKEMPSSDKKTVFWICVVCCLIATSGLIHAIVVSA